MGQRVLQLLHALGEQVTERSSQHGRAPGAQRPRRVCVDHGRPQIGVHQDHAPARVLQQGLAQRDGPLQVDLRVHLAERAVHPGGPPVGAADRRGLGAHQHPAAVLGQQRELVHLAPRCPHRGQEPVLHLPGVRAAHGPSGEALPSHGLGRAPAQDPLRLAVPVRHDPVRVEGAQGRVHAVEERGQQVRAVPLGLLRLVRPQLVGGPTTPGSTHLDPLQAASAVRYVGSLTGLHSTRT